MFVSYSGESKIPTAPHVVPYSVQQVVSQPGDGSPPALTKAGQEEAHEIEDRDQNGHHATGDQGKKFSDSQADTEHAVPPFSATDGLDG